MMIILGLGNPGPRYLLTRHNAGFRVIDRLSAKAKIPLYKAGYHSFYGRGAISGQEVVLAKPMTFMNNSGLAAASLCRAFGVSPDRLLVVCDDLDLPPGRLRLRAEGGSGGHNGLNSLITHLDSDRFPRLRIGIGRPAEGEVADYVLEEIPGEEEAEFEQAIALAVEAAAVFLAAGITEAMNKFNATRQL
jgi:peptidyl-tRNA hydrolase, PTH1 family